MHTTVTHNPSSNSLLFRKMRGEELVNEYTWQLDIRFDLQAREILKCTRSEVLIGKEAPAAFKKLKREFKKLGLPFKRRTWTKSLDEWREQSPTDEIGDIPNVPGVYYFWDKSGKLLYIGKSIRLKERVQSHFSSDLRLPVDRKIRKLCRSISYEPTLDELSALLLEANEIKSLNPSLNRALRSKRKPYGTLFSPNKQGYYTAKDKFLRVDQEKELREQFEKKGKNPPFVIPFHSKLARESFLDKHVKAGRLCRAPGSGRACFYRQIDTCQGACEMEESSETYNKRLLKIFADVENSLSFQGDLALLSKKAHEWENSSFRLFILFEDSVYQGFGYLPSDERTDESVVTTVANLKEKVLCEGWDTRDIRRIISKGLKKKEFSLIRFERSKRGSFVSP